MADYWKSQDRKYCDFCKCWITDNKPSRDFHENGRRHKENVKKRLKTITRNSAKAAKETEKADATIRAMEVAAMDAYRRDVQDSSASDLTSIAIRKRLADGNLEIAGGSSQKVWHEAVAKDGKSYFWNTMTNETQWSAPREGYYSIMQQKADQEREAQKKGKQIARKQQREELMAAQARREEEQEERARQEREKLKIRRVKEDTPPPTYGPIIEPGKTDPYGKWQTVQISVPDFDLQLPEQSIENYECPVLVEPEPEIKEFKEKTVENLDTFEESGSFKKRKVVFGPKRNIRQRLDVD
ncbi:hypothetical protein ABEB36_011711 [Hypothenemus hampei]|uniref:WW domain-binding protein 4 n=1 Tax=Hypothenemus hampei TaxID=57062 RepID=A0ABD1E8S5_HYPHA